MVIIYDCYELLFRSNLGRCLIHFSGHFSVKSYYLSENFLLFCVVICHFLTLILFDQPLLDLTQDIALAT